MARDTQNYPDMSADLSQLKTLTAMADDAAASMSALGLSASAQRQMRELRALLSAISAYASKAYETSTEEA